jgi:hypothetical protein
MADETNWQNIHKFTSSKLIQLYTEFLDLATKNMSTKKASVVAHTPKLAGQKITRLTLVGRKYLIG